MNKLYNNALFMRFRKKTFLRSFRLAKKNNLFRERIVNQPPHLSQEINVTLLQEANF